jgi:hypothetical protein
MLFPFYIKYSLEIYDDLMEGYRIIFVRLKRKFGKEIINIGREFAFVINRLLKDKH